MQSILGNTRRHDLVFHVSGRIDLSASVGKQLSLKNGDSVDIAEHSGEYYLYVKTRNSDRLGRHIAQCFSTNKRLHTCNTFRCQSRKLAQAVLQLCNLHQKACIAVGQALEIENYGICIPLITRTAKGQ